MARPGVTAPPETARTSGGNRSRLGLLLFSEVCLLAAMAGILACRFFWPGLLTAAVILLLDMPRSCRPLRVLCLAASFFCAYGYTALRLPEPPPAPAWLERAAWPAENAQGEILPADPIRLRGSVARVDALPGDRIRIRLEQCLPAPANAEEDREGASPLPGDGVYPGAIAWVWHHPTFIPLAGDVVEATVSVRPQRSFSNPGTVDIERYWHDRGVWFRAWSGSRTDLRLIRKNGADPPGLLHPGLLRTVASARRALQKRFEAALPRDARGAATPAAGLLPALLFGDRSRITPEQSDLFARSTLAHSLALSGLHLGFAGLAGFALASALGRLRPGLWLIMPRPKLALLLSLPFAGLYLWLGQAPVSLLRAAAMLFFSTVLLLSNRPRVLIGGLFAALAALLLFNPLSLFDLSLQLSALCIAAIALVLPFLTALSSRLFPPPDKTGRHVGPLPRKMRIWRAAVVMSGISLVIQVALLPLTATAFGGSGLLFPLNLLWLPVLSLVVLPLAFLGLFASALGLETTAAFMLQGAALPCDALLGLLLWLDKAGLLAAPLLPRPHWLTAAGFWLLCLGIAMPLTRRIGASEKRPEFFKGDILLVIAAVCLLLLPPAMAVLENRRTGVSLRLLDVGQGQAVLLEWTGLDGATPHGRVLVDGGGFASATFDAGKALVAPVLTENALPRLEAVINSHPDTDHLAGLIYILEHFAVGRYLTNGDSATGALAAREARALAGSGLVPERLAAGDALELAPSLRLEVIWPPEHVADEFKGHGKGGEKGNNASLVMRLVWRGKPLALLCGDAESPTLSALLAQGAPLEARVLVLPHHGAASSHVPAFYDAAGPSLALASCGYGNQWGFPSANVRRSLRERRIPLLTTAESGQIRLVWRSASAAPLVRPARQRQF
ncbi:MAG: DNA internalization-related competence protein ComEC/Rec2 [Desulfovibrio sp.]|nr:DNA internalization-related competence protein ComEC/Rec2 [Desulfovibrio sp.]